MEFNALIMPKIILVQTEKMIKYTLRIARHAWQPANQLINATMEIANAEIFWLKAQIHAGPNTSNLNYLGGRNECLYSKNYRLCVISFLF